MTDKERKMNNIHNAIREMYGETVDCISYYDGEEEPFPCD